MSHPKNADSISGTAQADPKTRIPTRGISKPVGNESRSFHSSLLERNEAYDVESKASKGSKVAEPHQGLAFHRDAFIMQNNMIDTLKSYRLDDRQLSDIRDGYGHSGIYRFLNEPNNSVLARTDPGFYNAHPVESMGRDATSPNFPHSSLSSWVDVSHSATHDQEEELELLSTYSGFHIVDGKGL